MHVRWDVREALHLIASYVHIRPGYREKSLNLQGTLKLHLRYYNRISRLQKPRNENWHAHFSLRESSMVINSVVGRIHLVCKCKSLIPGYVHIFQQYLQHTYMWIHVRWDVRDA